MIYRGKSVKNSIIHNNKVCETGWRRVVCEPGDMTKYDLMFYDIGLEMGKAINQPTGSLIVMNLNLTDIPTSMFLRGGDIVDWKTIQDGLDIQAEGSCYFISLLVATLYYFRCGTFENFEDDIKTLAYDRSR